MTHTEIKSLGSHAIRAGILLSTLTLVTGMASVSGPAQPAAASGSGCATAVVRPVGPFHIRTSDNRTIVDSKGRTFISYGTTVPGLSDPKLTTAPSKDIAKINATANYWCGNTIRLQVSQYAVTHNTGPDNGGTCQASYLNHALDPEVRQAEADGLVVVINDQTESDSNAVSFAQEELDPTKATFAFWNCVTAHKESWRPVSSPVTYGRDPQVIFDIFNEPRADSCKNDIATYPNGNSKGFYNTNLWRNGGLSNGDCGPAYNYQGMDAVAYHIRNEDKDTRTLLWVEGPGTAGTLAGLGQPDCGSTPTGNCFISPSLGPLVYSVHHPYGSDPTRSSPPADSSTWWNEFGWVVDHPAATGWAPVVLGEWTNFDSHDGAKVDPGKSCWSTAPNSIPNFLSYLKTIGVGLNAYQLAAPTAGYLLKANGSWTDTTNYTDATWHSTYCIPGTSAPVLAAGSLIRKWFQRQN